MDDVSVYFSPGKDPETNIVGFINACVKSLDVAMFAFSSAHICAALFDADRRGIFVRLILDGRQTMNSYSAYAKFIKSAPGDIAVVVKAGRGVMHNKFAIGDGNAVITGSYNWTESARRANNENLVIIRRGSAVGKFINEFNMLWQEFQ